MRNRGTLIVTVLAVLIVLLIGTIHDLTIAESMTHWGLGYGGGDVRWSLTMVLLAVIIGGLVLLVAVRHRATDSREHAKRTSSQEPSDTRLHP